MDRVIEQIINCCTIKAEEGDYLKNGLIHCGKCNTPKEVEIDCLGIKRKVFCLCKCKAEERERLAKEREEIERQQEIERLRSSAFIQSELYDCRFEKDDKKNEKASEVAKNYVKNFEELAKKGKGLMLYGTVGTGKTFLASCIANALIDKGYPCLVTNFARLVNEISGRYEGKQEYIDSLAKYSLLVIDDLSAERNTEYMQEIVWNIIDARYRTKQPMIVTTNLSASEITKPSDIAHQRIYSRLLEMCVPVQVAGDDRRKEKMKEDYSELKEMLGL